MVDLISFPFRLGSSGAVSTRDDASDQYLAEELAQLIQTHPGERDLVPSYGLNDPTFTRLDESMLAAQVSTFGPPVQIRAVEARYLSDKVQDVVVKFEPLPQRLDDGGAGTRIAVIQDEEL